LNKQEVLQEIDKAFDSSFIKIYLNDKGTKSIKVSGNGKKEIEGTNQKLLIENGIQANKEFIKGLIVKHL
jgi:hypothetical protein